MLLTYIILATSVNEPEPTAIPFSISIDQMTIAGNHECSTENCPADTISSSACGKSCWTKLPNTASFEYTFVGEKFQIYGKNEASHGSYEIYLDDELVTTINQNQEPYTTYILQYESEIIPYGQHKIKTVGKGDKAYQIYKFAFWPSVYAKRINISDFDGQWTKSSDGLGGLGEWVSRDHNMQVVKRTKIEGSKIWVYGSLSDTHGRAEFKVGDEDFTFTEQWSSRIDNSLVKETIYFTYGEKEVTFRQLDPNNGILINCIYYYPYPEPPVPVSIPINQMNRSSGDTTCTTEACDNTSPSPTCGQKCVSTGNHQAWFQYSFIGVKFQVFGTRARDYGSYSIYINDQKVKEIDQGKPPYADKIIQYTSDILPYSNYTIKVQGNGGKPFGFYKFAYWPSLYTKRLNITDFDGTWRVEADGIGGLQEWVGASHCYSVNKTATIEGSKIWIYGSKDTGHRYALFLIDGEDYSFTEQGPSRMNIALVYDSPHILLKSHDLLIRQKATDGGILLNYIYYSILPPPYIDRNYTELDTEQIQTYRDRVRQISGCIFKDVLIPTRDFYIKAETELLFYDNIFENTENPTSNTAGILWVNYNGKITISNCKFIKIASRGNDCLVLNTNAGDGTNLDVVIDKCEFIDCGRTGKNTPLVNTNNDNGILKFYDCNFTFNQPHFTFKVFESKNNNAVFERCQFTNCASNTIRIGTRGENPTGTFIFRDNVVKSNQGCLILAEKLRSEPIIEGNIIESTTLTNSYLIYISHNQAKVEMTNNTFSQITNNANSNTDCGGAGIYLVSSSSEYSIKYTKCKFYDITNNKEGSPQCNGGAFQHGFSTRTNSVIELNECEFKRNIANSGHGGGVALRTTKSVSVLNCVFEGNTANQGSQDRGFGGGLYICTSVDSNDQVQNTESITISGCTFKSNHGYQGYGIYIQGSQESSTTISINENNKFTTNEGTIEHPKGGCIIACEILSVTSEYIESNNDFSEETSSTVKHFCHVDSIGNPLPDPTSPPKPTDVIVVTPEDVIDKRVDMPNDDLSATTETTPVVQVIVSDFIDIKYNGDFGGAIYVTNYGLECKQIKFDNCSSLAAGGGIYVKQDNTNINKDIDLNNLEFIKCKAVYGGAIYIYSESQSNTVSIKSCKFTKNEASNEESLPMFGGSAIFLTTLMGLIVRCKFSENIGASVKIYNDLLEKNNGLLLSSRNSVLIKECEFDSTLAKASLYYVRGKKGVPCEVSDCSFTGKLADGSKYIDGKTIDESGHKLVVKNCKFDVNQFKLNKQKIADVSLNYISIDLKNQLFKSELKEEKHFSKLSLTVILSVGIVFAVVVVVILKRMRIQEDEEAQQQAINNDI